MEKFVRANRNRCTASPAANAPIIDAHSNAIEAMEQRVRHLEDTAVLIKSRAGCYVAPPIPLKWHPTMTADEAAAVILAEQDKLLAKLKDPDVSVWTRGVVALLIGALREHGREGR